MIKPIKLKHAKRIIKRSWFSPFEIDETIIDENTGENITAIYLITKINELIETSNKKHGKTPKK